MKSEHYRNDRPGVQRAPMKPTPSPKLLQSGGFLESFRLVALRMWQETTPGVPAHFRAGVLPFTA
jgi:hypothetical protein